MSDGMPREIWAWQSDPEDDDNWENGHIQAWEGSGECGDGTTRYIRADADAEVRKALADKLTNEEISIEKAQSLIADAVVDLSPEYKIALNRRFDSKERANLKRLRSM